MIRKLRPNARDVVLVGAAIEPRTIHRLSLELARALAPPTHIFEIDRAAYPLDVLTRLSTVATMPGAPLRVVLLLRASQARPIAEAVTHLSKRAPWTWLPPEDLFDGVPPRSRFVFLERAIKLARDRAAR